MEAYLITAGRIVTIIPLVFCMTLLMGKRQVGELPVFDFVIAIVLGAVVGADIADPSIEHGPTVLAIVLLVLLQIGSSYGILKSRRFRHIMRFEPTIIVQNGKLLKHNLRKIRYSLDQVLELLRLNGVFNLAEVEFALVEANGEISILRKSQEEPVRARDLGISTPYRGLATTVIYDGKADFEMLERLDLNGAWLEEELQRLGISSVKDVFYAELDSEGHLYVALQKPGVAEDKKQPIEIGSGRRLDDWITPASYPIVSSTLP